MIKVLVAFPVMGSCCLRWIDSMKKYLPDDIVITQVLDARTTYMESNHDIVLTQRGAGTHYPFTPLVTPKVIFTEATDEVTLSYMTDKDILVSYNHDEVIRIKQLGFNAILLPRPADTEIFYPEYSEKVYDIITVNHHQGWAELTDAVVDSMGGKHLLMMNRLFYNLAVNADIDYCEVTLHDDRMRQDYCRSKYVVSLLEEYNYYPDKWTVGWEAGNIEGLLCGARPICIKPKRVSYYDKWFGKYILYVDKNNFVSDLHDILTGDYKPVTDDEIREVAYIVNAEKVWTQLWNEVRRVLGK